MGYGLPKVMDALDCQEITNMLVWLNSDNLVGKATRLLFLRVQDKLRLPTFPGEAPHALGQHGVRNTYYHFLSRLAARHLLVRTLHPSFAPSTTATSSGSCPGTSGTGPGTGCTGSASTS
jgi:hypothetical protein